MKRYDRKSLSNAINFVAGEIMKAKEILRESGQPRREPGGATERHLRAIKKDATDLCCLAAAIRGRLHLRNGETVEDVKQRLAGLAATFEKKEAIIEEHAVA